MYTCFIEVGTNTAIVECPTAIVESPLGLETEGGEEIKGGMTLGKGEGEVTGGSTRVIGGEDSEFIRKYICIYINTHFYAYIWVHM
jgi:hypothetical protein